MSLDSDVMSALPQKSVTDAQVRRIMSDLTGINPDDDPDAWEACEDAILGALEPDRGLRMRPGGWTVDLTNTTVRVVVASGLIAACMWYTGLDQLPAFILPQVLPLLFDITKARLTRQDERLLLNLRLTMTTEQLQYPWSPEALFQRLPEDLRSVVSSQDFDDFIRRLVQAGEADNAGFDEIRIRPIGKPAWLRISIR
jgi:hypothetical protein